MSQGNEDGVRFADWRIRVDNELGEADFDRVLVSRLPGGIEVQPLYTAHDLRVLASKTGSPEASGFPGLLPFTRGSGARTAGWTLAQTYGQVDPVAVNQALREDLIGGAGGLWLRFDRLARLGQAMESDEALQLIGVDGAALHSFDDLDRALSEVHPEMVEIGLDAGANALPAAALLLAWLESRKANPREMRLCFGADPLGALARDGRLPASLGGIQRQIAALAHHCDSHLPKARTMLASTRPYHEAGANPVQELAYGLATGVEYLRSLVESGLSVRAAAKQVGFAFAIGSDVFTEIAKLRAARLLWGKILFGSNVSTPPSPFIHAETSARSLARRDPWVNMLRVTTQVFAAVVGGCDSLSSTPFDAALGEPDGLGRRVARNTQVIAAEESHLGSVIDPAGGSYYVETLTEELARAAWERFQAIEAAGGMSAALLAGSIRTEVEESWQERRREIAQRRRPVLGVTEYPNPGEELPLRPAERNPEVLEAVRQKSAARRVGRPVGAKTFPLEVKVDACINAAAAGAPIDELTARLKGADQAPTIAPFPQRRDGEVFEALRDAADALGRRSGPPKVALACLGPIPEHRQRASFARHFLAAGGFVPVMGGGTGKAQTADAAALVAAELEASGARLVCLCGSDERYREMAPQIIRSLKRVGAGTILAAGHPGANEPELRDAGIEIFLHRDSDVHAILTNLLRAAGATVSEVS